MKLLVTFMAIICTSLHGKLFITAEIETAWYESHLFHILNVKRLQSVLVTSYVDCGLACTRDTLCVSFNVPVNSDGNKKIRCDLLPSSSYRNEGKLIPDPQFHHFLLLKNPCSSQPCLNNGICSPVSFRVGTYKCSCHPGYLGDHCDKAPPECSHYSVLNETDRYQSYGRGSNSDQALAPGWYRFKSSSYSRMTDTCIDHHRCTTDITGWLNGALPSLEDGIVVRKACFHGFYNCCHRIVQIRVRECAEGFYVYDLVPSPQGTYRYCAKE